MSNKKTSGGFPFIVSALAIAICLVIGIVVYKFVLGDAANFDAEGPEKDIHTTSLVLCTKEDLSKIVLLGTLFTVITFI